MVGLPEALVSATRKSLIASEGDPAVLRQAVLVYLREGTRLGIPLTALITELLKGPQCISRKAYFGDPQVLQLIEMVKCIKTDRTSFE
jgi:hypothetical protein